MPVAEERARAAIVEAVGAVARLADWKRGARVATLAVAAEAEPAAEEAGAANPVDIRAAGQVLRLLPGLARRNRGIRFSRAVHLFRRWDRPN